MVLLFMYSTSWWFHEVILLDAEKELVKVAYAFVVKTLRKLEIQENVLNLIIDIYKKTLYLMVKFSVF